jgi:glycerophosphoryl diester phosphodiesterase
MAQLVAHRGQSSDFPENTLEAVQRAISCGATAVEFDLQMTADRVPVVCHDMSLQRCAGVAINIAELSYADLKAFSVGESVRLAESFPTIRLTSLQGMIALLADAPQVTAFIELKGESTLVFGIDCFVQQVIAQVESIAGRCVMIADNLDALLAVRQQLSLRIGWIVHRWDETDRLLAQQCAVDYLVIDHRHCHNRKHDFRADPWEWMAYETCEPELAADLFAQGIRFVETNDICAMLEELPEYRAHGQI